MTEPAPKPPNALVAAVRRTGSAADAAAAAVRAGDPPAARAELDGAAIELRSTIASARKLESSDKDEPALEPVLEPPEVEAAEPLIRPADETPFERRLWAAMLISQDLLGVEALALSEPVPVETLNPEWVERLGLTDEAWFSLDDKMARRVEMLRRAKLARDPVASSPSEPARPESFVGRSHAEVLDWSFADEPADLIEGLVPRSVLVTTAGLPEAFKGWTCIRKAEIIATGAGELLGCKALAQGPVGYWWQDDSDRNEAERVQLYAQTRKTPRDLPIRWFINEGLQLPRDMERLRATIEHFGFIYVVLDSFYNVASGLDLKDREPGIVFVELKTEICDRTGCTVDVVDHMPWATDTNRKRLRGYGDVFKNAAVRAGLYIDLDGNKIHVEARGNNIRGFARRPAYWDPDTLELRLVDSEKHSETLEEIRSHIRAYLAEQADDWHATNTVIKSVDGTDKLKREALWDLFEQGEITLSVGGPGKPVQAVGEGVAADYRRPKVARYWKALNHAPSQSAIPWPPSTAETTLATPEEDRVGESATPRRGESDSADDCTGFDSDPRETQ